MAVSCADKPWVSALHCSDPIPMASSWVPCWCFHPAGNEDGVFPLPSPSTPSSGLSYCPTVGTLPTSTLGTPWFLLLIDRGTLSPVHQWSKTCCCMELLAVVSVRKEAWAICPHLLCSYIFAKSPESHPFLSRLWPLHNQTNALQQKCARKGITCLQCATGITWHHYSLALPQGISGFVLPLLKKLAPSQDRALVPQKETEDKHNLSEIKLGNNDLLIEKRAQTCVLRKTQIVLLKCCKMCK